MKHIGSKAIEYMALDVEAESVIRANVKTGDLRSSISAQPRGDDSWAIGTNLDYAVFPHEGFGAFELNRSVLIDGHWVYIGRHPGYKGNPWFDDSLEIAGNRTEEYLSMATSDLE